MKGKRRTATMTVAAIAIATGPVLTVGAAESLLTRLLRIAGLTAAPSQMRAPEDAAAGDVWIVTLDEGAAKALTQGGGYRSPIFAADGRVFAVKDSSIVQVSPTQGGTPVKVPNLVKLVGFDREHRDELVVVVDPPVAGSPLAVVSLTTRAVTPLPVDPASQQEQLVVAEARSQNRVFGDASVYVKTESKRGMTREIRWTDVYVKRGNGEPQNVSKCDGVDCTEPSLSADGKTLAFVRSLR
jgi:hypothetical protein